MEQPKKSVIPEIVFFNQFNELLIGQDLEFIIAYHLLRGNFSVDLMEASPHNGTFKITLVEGKTEQSNPLNDFLPNGDLSIENIFDAIQKKIKDL